MVLFTCPRFRLAAVQALQEGKRSTDLMRVILALAVTVEHADRADIWQRGYLVSMTAKRAKLLESLGLVRVECVRAHKSWRLEGRATQ